MRTERIYVFIFSLLVSSFIRVNGQDTVYVPLKLRFGPEVSGIAVYLAEKKTMSLEGYASYDLSENRAVFLSAGYADYPYSQYNYEYKANGIFARTGLDFNLLKPPKSKGIYYAGIGLHYGISRFNSEVSSFTTENYWGPVTSALPDKSGWAHFFEVTPGVRAEIFKNFSIGWIINVRLMLSSGSEKDLRPLYIPGFGNGSKRLNTAISYYISWNIPYRTKRVIIQPEPVEEQPAAVTTP
ncbi:MAG TPA: DUF6048 family protein [Bacteroidales bacterium]|nr:DUF6048 family protein [Bacteroidales bacterium]